MDIKKLGLKELCESEAKNVNGGADYLIPRRWTTSGENTCISIYNAGAWLWNCITGQEGGYVYLN